MSTAQRDLLTLLVEMRPTLDPRDYVFCHVGHDDDRPELQPLMIFREAEGTTLILERDDAERAGLACEFHCRRITLSVHSDLTSVGFLSAVGAELARHGISTNAVSAFYHDHLFVPTQRAHEAVRVLDDLSASSARRALSSHSL